MALDQRARLVNPLRSWRAASPLIAMVVILMIAAVLWALKGKHSPEAVAGTVGAAVFGGMFLITGIAAAILLNQSPEPARIRRQQPQSGRDGGDFEA